MDRTKSLFIVLQEAPTLLNNFLIGFIRVDDRVVHHDHVAGKIYGLADNQCNLRQRTQSFAPVFFQNLSKYDYHL